MSDEKTIVIYTSNPEWYLQVVEAAKSHLRVRIINDRGIDISNASSLWDLIKQAGDIDWRKVLALLGITGIGALIILAAILDPEPTSKLALIAGAGALIAVSGAGGAIYLLVGKTPMKMRAKGGNPPEFEVSFG